MALIMIIRKWIPTITWTLHGWIEGSRQLRDKELCDP